MIRNFCIAHKAPTYPLPDDIPVIWLGAAPVQTNGQHQVFHVAEISEEFDAWHPFLAGAAGAFAIEKILNQDRIDWNSGDKISILQYRKFILPEPLLNTTRDPQGLYIPSRADLDKMDLHEIQKSIDLPYLLAIPYEVQNLYLQYSAHHKAQDLLRYTALAIDMGIITWDDASNFLNSTLIIQGGVEFGIYPISIFLEIIEKLRILAMEFLKRHNPASMSIEQRRGIAFCSERLGSHLLYKQLGEEYDYNIPNELFGYMHYAL